MTSVPPRQVGISMIEKILRFFGPSGIWQGTDVIDHKVGVDDKGSYHESRWYVTES